MGERTVRTEDEWRRKLTPEQFRVLREGGTEAPFTGKYHDSRDRGTYLCAACGTELFSSDDKFDSGTGWPSFTKPVHGAEIPLAEDGSHGMVRQEATCARCGSHLGHMFADGPQKRPDGKPSTGKRFCVNSAALIFRPERDAGTSKGVSSRK